MDVLGQSFRTFFVNLPVSSSLSNRAAPPLTRKNATWGQRGGELYLTTALPWAVVSSLLVWDGTGWLACRKPCLDAAHFQQFRRSCVTRRVHAYRPQSLEDLLCAVSVSWQASCDSLRRLVVAGACIKQGNIYQHPRWAHCFSWVKHRLPVPQGSLHSQLEGDRNAKRSS